jgi:general secretion pathway protein J
MPTGSLPDRLATTRLLRPAGGFTLLELLVALGIFVLLAAAAHTSLRSVLYTQAAVEVESRRLAEVQLAFHLLELDLTQVINRQVRGDSGDSQPPLVSGGLDGNLLSFTRSGWDNPLGYPRSNLQRVAYRLAGNELLRLHWATLDRGGLEEPGESVLLSKVREVQLRFLDRENAWKTEWPPLSTETVAENLPRAVNLSITLDDWGTINRLFLLPGA